ncbi:hypothetical protein D3C83_319700 [compost metagenome]
MHVVGHQHIGVDGQSVFAGGAFKTVQVKEVIGFRPEDRIAVVAALDDMKRLTVCEVTG